MLSLAIAADDSIWTSMFAFQVPPTEKIIRTILVYLAIAILIRIGGKRTLAQLNTLDLVVMLLLSNVVQNAIIGEDNSLVGGILGAVVLVGFNALVDRLSFLGPTAERILDGSPTTLITDGKVDEDALRKVGLRKDELMAALRHQQADNVSEVRNAQMEPGGTIDVELKRAEENASTGELDAAVKRLEEHLDQRLSDLEARLISARG